MIPVDEQIEAPEQIQHELVNEDVFAVKSYGYVNLKPGIARLEAIQVTAEIQARKEANRDPQNPIQLLQAAFHIIKFLLYILQPRHIFHFSS